MPTDGASRPGLESLRPGDIVFGPIGGIVPGLFPVAFGQLLLAPAERRRTVRDWWGFRHVAVVTSDHSIVQAMPSGAEEIEIGAEHWTHDYLYVRPRWTWMDQGEVVAKFARQMIGT